MYRVGWPQAVHERALILSTLVREFKRRRYFLQGRRDREDTASVARKQKFFIETKETRVSKNIEKLVRLQSEKELGECECKGRW